MFVKKGLVICSLLLFGFIVKGNPVIVDASRYGNGRDCSKYLQKVFDSYPSRVLFKKGTYVFKDVVVKHNVIIEGEAGAVIKPVIRKKAYRKTGLTMLNNLLYAQDVDSIVIRGLEVRSQVTGTLIPSGYKSNRYYSDPLFDFRNARKVEFDSCKFNKVEGCTYCSTSYTYYGNKRGLLINLYDVDEAIIQRCDFSECRHDEQVWSIPVEKPQEQIHVVYDSNYIHDETPGINSSAFTCVAGDVVVKNNIVVRFHYKGSIFNLFGRKVRAENNTIINSYATSVFDTGEYGYFFCDTVIVKNNHISAKNSQLLATIADYIDIEDNCFNGLTLLLAENNPAIAHSKYTYFYQKQDAKPACSKILIKNNDASFTNYDPSLPIVGPAAYGYGIFIFPSVFPGESVIIDNNTFTSLDTIANENDVNSLEKYHHNIMRIVNMNRVSITNNICSGSWYNFDSSVWNSPILIEIDARLFSNESQITERLRNMKSIIIENNTFSSSRSRNAVLTTNRRNLQKPLIINHLIVSGNRFGKTQRLNIPILYNTFVLKGELQSDLSTEFYSYPYIELVSDLAIPLNRKGKIIQNKNEFKAEYAFQVESIEKGKRLENGVQVLFPNNQIWKSCNVVFSFNPEETPVLVDDNLMRYQNVYWMKVL